MKNPNDTKGKIPGQEPFRADSFHLIFSAFVSFVSFGVNSNRGVRA